MSKKDMESLMQNISANGPGALYTVAKDKFNMDREELNTLICSIVNKQDLNSGALSNMEPKLDLYRALIDEESPDLIYSKIILDAELKEEAYNFMKEYDLDLDEFNAFLSQVCERELLKENSFAKAELLAFLFKDEEVDLGNFKEAKTFINSLADFAKLEPEYTRALMCY